MNQEIDQQTMQTFNQLFAEMKETKRKDQANWEQRIWKDIQFPFSLYEGLSQYPKTELDKIRKQLKIKNASNLKKADLIHVLTEQIPQILGKVCSTFDHERFQLMSEMVKQGGSLKAPHLKEAQIEYLRACGFLFTGTFQGERILAVPQDLLNQLKELVNNPELTATVHRNTEWIQLTHGLLFYYGTLNFNDLITMLEKHSDIEVTEFLSVIDNAISYDQSVKIDEHGISNIRVFDPNKVREEHQMRSTLSYHPFSKKQLLQAGRPDYVEKNDSFKKLVFYLTKNYQISKEKAESLVEECVYATQIGEQPSSVLRFLSTNIEFNSMEEIQGITEHVVALMNHTRQWFLKGHTSSELSPHKALPVIPKPKRVGMKTNHNVKVKVGRNDPCTCGSGKKYKKCCGA